MLPTRHTELVRILATIDQKLERAKELMAQSPDTDTERFVRAFGYIVHLEGARLATEGELEAGD